MDGYRKKKRMQRKKTMNKQTSYSGQPQSGNSNCCHSPDVNSPDVQQKDVKTIDSDETCEVVEKKVECIDLMSSGEDSDGEEKNKKKIRHKPTVTTAAVSPASSSTAITTAATTSSANSTVDTSNTTLTPTTTTQSESSGGIRRLRDFETISNIVNTHPPEYLLEIYELLFLKKNEVHADTLRNEILDFTGFTFEKGSQDYVKRKQVLDRMPYNNVQRVYDTLIHNSTEETSKRTMINEIFQFLFKLPDHDTNGEEKNKKKIRHKPTVTTAAVSPASSSTAITTAATTSSANSTVDTSNTTLTPTTTTQSESSGGIRRLRDFETSVRPLLPGAKTLMPKTPGSTVAAKKTTPVVTDAILDLPAHVSVAVQTENQTCQSIGLQTDLCGAGIYEKMDQDFPNINFLDEENLKDLFFEDVVQKFGPDNDSLYKDHSSHMPGGGTEEPVIENEGQGQEEFNVLKETSVGYS